MPWNKSVLCQNSVGDSDYSVLTAGSGVTLTPGAGILTVAATGGPGAEAFPVGSVFLAVVSTNPATLLGYGTWVSFGAGRVLVGLDSGDTDFDVAEETGGAKTVAATGTISTPTFAGDALAGHTHGIGTYAADAHAGTAVADHASHTHTYTQVPNHVHVQNLPTSQTGGQSSGTRDTSTTGSAADALSTANPTGGVATGTTNGPGATLTHAVTQPNTHTLSGSSASVSAGTPSGTVTQPTFTGNATSVVQPYIVVYMFKRTA